MCIAVGISFYSLSIKIMAQLLCAFIFSPIINVCIFYYLLLKRPTLLILLVRQRLNQWAMLLVK